MVTRTLLFSFYIELQFRKELDEGQQCKYIKIQNLYKNYEKSDFVILGFPSRDFMYQEYNDESKVKEFCSTEYGVTFPMMSKISVKGSSMHPIYKFLTSKEEMGYQALVFHGIFKNI